MRCTAIAIVVVLLAPAPAASQTPGACTANANTTLELRACLDRDLKRTDSTMALYLREAQRLATARAILDSAQAAWIRFRDVSCRAAGEQFAGGTLQPVTILSCRVRVANNRIRDLWEDYLRGKSTALRPPSDSFK